MTPDEISTLRKAAGLTQAQLAKKIGVTTETVANKETGRTKITKTDQAALALALAPAP